VTKSDTQNRRNNLRGRDCNTAGAANDALERELREMLISVYEEGFKESLYYEDFFKLLNGSVCNRIQIMLQIADYYRLSSDGQRPMKWFCNLIETEYYRPKK
jgi:hypothetical protein